jgi:hypothetical protein
VTSARSRVQGEERGRVAGQHEARGLCLLRSVRPGGAGAAAVLLLPHVARVLRAPATASFSQLHRSGGHFRPPLRDACGGTAIGAAVLTLLRAEGCEHTPAAHRRSLLPAPYTGLRLLHRAHFPWQVVQADVHDRLALPVGGPTLNRTKWGKDPGLEPNFDAVLDRIQYLAENGLTSLMVLHDFLSKRLMPLQDRSHRPA